MRNQIFRLFFLFFPSGPSHIPKAGNILYDKDKLETSDPFSKSDRLKKPDHGFFNKTTR
jgi:hypothetical protein